MFPEKLNPWLREKGSITDKLKAKANHIHLDVVSHQFESPDTWDINHLKLQNHTEILHREIIMWADTKACWYARTILPKSVYDIEKALFNQLKTTPLGVLIHHHPEIERSHINPYKIHTNMPEYDYLKHALKQNTPNKTLWGRVSTFTIRHQFNFYLLEIFLPALQHYYS